MDIHFRRHPIILSKYAGSGRQSSTQKLGQDTKGTYSLDLPPPRKDAMVATEGLVGDSLLKI